MIKSEKKENILYGKSRDHLLFTEIGLIITIYLTVRRADEKWAACVNLSEKGKKKQKKIKRLTLCVVHVEKK